MEYDVSNEIFKSKYQYKDETIEGMWRRIAKSLASVEQDKEKYEEQFYEALKDFKFIPGGRIIANAGTDRKNTCFVNCFAMPDVPDSMQGIFDVLQKAALTQKAGGGVGFNFSRIRPKGTFVKGCEAEASGPLSFARVFDSACRTIMSAGSRRGAQIAILNIDHPDIYEYIQSKRDGVSLQMFNISVGVFDSFMDALAKDGDWDLKWEGKVYQTVKAKDLWNTIMESTYNHAEPGVLFLDRINQMNNLNYCEHVTTVNPCMAA